MALAQLGADVVRFGQLGSGLDYQRWPLTGRGDSLFLGADVHAEATADVHGEHRSAQLRRSARQRAAGVGHHDGRDGSSRPAQRRAAPVTQWQRPAGAGSAVRRRVRGRWPSRPRHGRAARCRRHTAQRQPPLRLLWPRFRDHRRPARDDRRADSRQWNALVQVTGPTEAVHAMHVELQAVGERFRLRDLLAAVLCP
jgi:hypothetical protein